MIFFWVKKKKEIVPILILFKEDLYKLFGERTFAKLFTNKYRDFDFYLNIYNFLLDFYYVLIFFKLIRK